MKWIRIALALGCMAAATPALAQECRLAAEGLEFGTYDFTNPAPLDAAGAIMVSCTRGLAFRIRIDAGRNSGLGFNPRFMQMAGGGARIAYNLYIDPGHAGIWGDGDRSTVVYSTVGLGVPMQIPIFGRVFAGQPLPPGAYQDRLTITLEW